MTDECLHSFGESKLLDGETPHIMVCCVYEDNGLDHFLVFGHNQDQDHSLLFGGLMQF